MSDALHNAQATLVAMIGLESTPIAHGQLSMPIMNFLPGGSMVHTNGKLLSTQIKVSMLDVVNELTHKIQRDSKPACVAESVLRLVF